MLQILTSRLGLVRLFETEGAERVMASIERCAPKWARGGAHRVSFVEAPDQTVAPSTGVLIVGGAEVVPHLEVPNPVESRLVDPDASVFNDDGYGDGLRGVPVGRLPDFGPRKLESFLGFLERSAEDGDVSSLLAVTNPVWKRFTRRALDGFSGEVVLRTAPGWTGADQDWQSGSASILYFNLHGLVDRPAWRGFDGNRGTWRNALLPRQVTRASVENALVLAENCYGANATLVPAKHSVASRMLEEGARAFIGATGLAYGSHSALHSAILGGADLLAQKVLEGLSRESIGRALWAAKREVANLGGPFAQKTSLQFVLYGNPLGEAA